MISKLQIGLSDLQECVGQALHARCCGQAFHASCRGTAAKSATRRAVFPCLDVALPRKLLVHAEVLMCTVNPLPQGAHAVQHGCTLRKVSCLLSWGTADLMTAPRLSVPHVQLPCFNFQSKANSLQL